MISRHPDSATPIDKASKKPLNSDRVLVSRKAMQNYNRFSSPHNISDTFFRKKRFFLKLECFGTQVWHKKDRRGRKEGKEEKESKELKEEKELKEAELWEP